MLNNNFNSKTLKSMLIDKLSYIICVQFNNMVIFFLVHAMS